MKGVGNTMQWDALNHDGARSINDCDLRLRRGSLWRWVRVDMRDVELAAIGRRSDVTCAAPCGESLLFFTGLRIQHGDIVADAIGNEEVFAFAILKDIGRLGGNRPCRYHFKRACIDD